MLHIQFIKEENGVPFYKKAQFVTEGLNPELAWNNSTVKPGWEVRINSPKKVRSGGETVAIFIESRTAKEILEEKCSVGQLKLPGNDDISEIDLCTKQYGMLITSRPNDYQINHFLRKFSPHCYKIKHLKYFQLYSKT